MQDFEICLYIVKNASGTTFATTRLCDKLWVVKKKWRDYVGSLLQHS